MNLKDLAQQPEKITSGHRLCAGCAEPIIAKLVLASIKDPVVVINATGCLEVATTIYPYTAWKIPWMHNAFENAPATVSGIIEAYNVILRKKPSARPKWARNLPRNIKFAVFSGDGGSYDIGLQSLSGALERGHKFLYVCYDNEAYMNTGIQRSSATPTRAWTTTTPVKHPKETPKKDMVAIMAAHRIPYAATANIAFPEDLIKKVKKALTYKGTKFLHIYATCPTGWKLRPELAVKVARLAVETKVFPLYEIEWGTKWHITRKPKGLPVVEYLKLQGRFRHLTEEDVKLIQKEVDRNWQRLEKMVEFSR